MDVDILQHLIRWIINDSTIRSRSKIPVAYLSKPDHNLTRVVVNCSLNFILKFSYINIFFVIRCSTIVQYLFGSYA
jgi:hypothetical protein